MEIDLGALAKLATALASLGGGFAFARPFATRFFESWLTRAERREADEREKETAIVRVATSHERMVGVLEAVDKSITRTDARLDRIEAHLGIGVTQSAIPSPPPPAMPRRHLTDPAIESTPASPPSRAT